MFRNICSIFFCLLALHQIIHSSSVVAINFTCLNGEIVGANEICNGVANCADSSDEREELCLTTICRPNQFKCHYGACVDRIKFCNKHSDCLDGSDEFNCGRSTKSCDKLTEFHCSSNKSCISATLVCNNKPDCPRGEDEAICQRTRSICPKNSFRCSGTGICIDNKAICDNFNDCINGDDESDVLCKSFNCKGLDCSTPNCPPITSHRIIVSCTHNGKNVSCTDKIQPQTVAKYSCKKFYEPQSGMHKHNSEAICQRNGKWSSEILKCDAKCGYLKDSAVPLIVNGYMATKLFPWHATMFIKRGNQYEFACGATLISDHVVISAAHCFTGLNETDVKFAVGKRFSNITIRSTEEPNAKIFNVKRIHRHPMYLDSLGNYGQDIALVELKGIVELNDEVHPICIDWGGSEGGVAQNQPGILSGNGVTENETFSDVIRVAQLNVVSTEVCIKRQPRDFQKFITFTTFCAGTDNGTSACNGDSGGGFVQLSKNLLRWNLQGIVSLSPRKVSTFYCDPSKYTIFTKVEVYIKWIKTILDSIDDNSSSDEQQPRGDSSKGSVAMPIL